MKALVIFDVVSCIFNLWLAARLPAVDVFPIGLALFNACVQGAFAVQFTLLIAKRQAARER